MKPNTSDLLTPLTAAGVTIQIVDGNRLAVAPAARLTDGLRQHIRQHKVELLTLLAANDPHAPSPTPRNGALPYRLRSGAGGMLIDPDGIESAIATLRLQYGDKLDWLALINTLQNMGEAAQKEATKLIQLLQEGA